MKYVRGTVPAHVIAAHGSARKFKATKRRELREAEKAIDKLGHGCAFFPCGSPPVDKIRKALDEIAASISEKNWGR